MYTAIDYLTQKGWKISSDPRIYNGYPKNYGFRNYIENGINYDAFCGGYHRAFDLYSNQTDNIPAVTSGTVILSEPYGNFGGTIEVRDSNGNDWVYGHLQRDSLKFSKGDKVNQGDVIGLQGSSNYYDNPMNAHLHIQLRPKDTKTDEKSLVCSGMPIEKYDISKLNQKLDKSKNKGANVMGKKILVVAGHGGSDPGAVGNGTNERDFIRNNIVDNVAKYLKDAGHSVTIFPKQYDMLSATFNGTGQNGLYWAKTQGFDEVVEFHLDAASPAATGGHTIIYSGFSPDPVDKGIQHALESTVGTIRGITGRGDLGNARIAAQLGVSYRLVELGFITSKKDMDYIKNNLKSFTKAIATGINGKTVNAEPTKSKTEKKSINTIAKEVIAGKWGNGQTRIDKLKKAGYNPKTVQAEVDRIKKPTSKVKKAIKKVVSKTVFNWKGRFTVSEFAKPIGAKKKPGLKQSALDKSNNILAGQYVNFDQIIKKDGYWWLRFTYPTNPKSGKFYMAIGKIEDPKEKIMNEKNLWGKLKVTSK